MATDRHSDLDAGQQFQMHSLHQGREVRYVVTSDLEKIPTCLSAEMGQRAV
jgi:hypothetical protein